MNINLPDFYLGLWGFSAKYLGGKTLVHKGAELLIIKEKNMFGTEIVIEPELTIKSWTYYKTLALYVGKIVWQRSSNKSARPMRGKAYSAQGKFILKDTTLGSANKDL